MADITARFNPKTGIAEVRHGKYGWHWACARHKDDADADKAHMAAGKEMAKTDEAFKAALTRENVTRVRDLKQSNALTNEVLTAVMDEVAAALAPAPVEA